MVTPTTVGDANQEDATDMSSFADRFFWARQRSGLGAPTIAERIGCAQALISRIERYDQKHSTFNDKFAKLFGVDAEWLRSGGGKAPDGFDAAEAKRAREAGGPIGARIIRPAIFHANTQEPAWAAPSSDASDADRADSLQKRLFADFQDYAKLVGQRRAQAFIEVLTRLTALVAPLEKAERDDDRGAP